jgi:Tfp pilus assembly ATPase PilU
MKRFTSILVLAGLCAVPALASAASYHNVAVVDVMCSKKVAANPDAHTRECALKCAGSGFGIVTEDQKFLKFDAEGNAKITEALKNSDKKDHLRVNVDGDVQGDTLKVKSVELL